MSRLNEVDYLRAFSALAVLIFHATNTVENYPTTLWIRTLGSFGHLGVEAFFILSGFIIFYSLRSSDFSIYSYRRFLLKRVIRVEPLFILSILFSVALGVSVNIFYGREIYQYNSIQFFSHFLYASSLLGLDWINPVYWTLAIEFQFYLLAPLLYHLLTPFYSFSAIFIFTVLSGLAFLSIDTPDFLIFRHAFYFLLGVLIFSFRAKESSAQTFILGSTFLLFSILFLFGFSSFIVCFLSVLLLSRKIPGTPHFALKWLANISFPLYLFHYPIVEKVVRFGKIFGHSLPAQISVLALSVALSIAVAHAIHMIFERKFTNLSAKIRY